MQQTPWDFVPWRFVLLILTHIPEFFKIAIYGKKWELFLALPALRCTGREPRGSHAGATVSGSLHQTAAHGRAAGLSSCGGAAAERGTGDEGLSENNFPPCGGRWKILFSRVSHHRCDSGKCFFRPDMMRPVSRRRRKLKGQIE